MNLHRSLLTGLALLGVAGLCFAGDGKAGKSSRRAAGDGRGLATFGDRGLLPFGDRFVEGFGDRGLESFSDTPLMSIGGLVPDGGSADDRSHDRSSQGTRRDRRDRRERFGGITSAGGSFAGQSQASLRTSDGAFAPTNATVGRGTLLPALELPALVLDHRLALATLDSVLDAALQRAEAAGDLDLARSLDPDRR